MKSRNTPHLFLSLAACAALAACGGGGSTDNSATPSKDTVIGEAASTNIGNSGGSLLSTNSSLETYDLIADIGDTWQLVLDKTKNKYTLSIVQSAYGLVNTSNGTEGTFSQKTTSGSRTTYSLIPNGGSATELTTDSSTKTIAGNLKVGALNATVSGTAYKATDLSKLAGIYNFIQAAHDVRSNAASISRDTTAGQIRISSDGTTATACVDGTFLNNSCSGSSEDPKTFKFALDNAGRVVIKQSDDKPFGIATVVASNLGKALVIDQRNTNQANVERTGTWYLAEAKTLSNTSFDGQWRCAGQGADGNAIIVNGATGKTTNLITNATMDAVFKYNQVSTASGLQSVSGFMAGGASSDKESDYNLFLPISSTMGINELGDDQLLRICYKTSNN